MHPLEFESFMCEFFPSISKNATLQNFKTNNSIKIKDNNPMLKNFKEQYLRNFRANLVPWFIQLVQKCN